MKIIVAVDSFKGTLTSIEIASILKEYYEKLDHEVISIPISDGGEGFLDAIQTFHNEQLIHVKTMGPLQDETDASYIIHEDTAFLELSNVCGLNKIAKERLNPLETTTYGLGLLVKDAIEKGAKKIVLGLGGSSTNDAGAGMMQALGVQFYHSDVLITEKMNGRLLKEVTSFETKDIESLIQGVSFKMASDVKNPLLGKSGSAFMYAGQKGANKAMKETLEDHMTHFAKVVENYFKESFKNEPASGAAGGFGFGARAFLNAKINSGIDYIIELLEIEDHIKNADLVIVGEGKLDQQTLFGKAPFGIAKIAKKYNKKVIAIAAINDGKNDKTLVDEIYAIVPKYTDEKTSLANPRESLKKMLKEIVI